MPVDLSAVIFVVLALAWALYLIPKALQHHDEVAAERLDESHSDRARVVTRRRRTEEVMVVEDHGQRASTERPELSAMGRAARNRRRVLGGLLLALAAVWGLTWFAYLPSWAPAVPTLAVVGWLVLARVSVVRMKRRESIRPQRPVAEESPLAEDAQVVERAQQLTRDPVATSHASTLDARPEVVAEQQALADDGSLWDPLPLTLPTYVGKATARRTVRTIELTGVTSSGHDESDSALAREVTGSAADGEDAQERRVVGG